MMYPIDKDIAYFFLIYVMVCIIIVLICYIFFKIGDDNNEKDITKVD